MQTKSSQISTTRRHLRNEEKKLLSHLLLHFGLGSKYDKQIKEGFVVDMHDGGMGSVKFITDNDANFCQSIANAEYIDADNIPILITININTAGELHEFDFWKVDFSCLKKYPSIDELKLKHP